ncbi:alpha/beta fold hydrolase [Porphyromonas sp. COT-108 OH1349]|uniref:alpha/beta fold hydrolase n=1 Tax=Porphyromonas sp. COT-108 OH1349 TaxID=1537504 RepID=UPI00052E2C90|nr:alpha/beta fold hydrolase [Porphyromonas sp. COT-108 OH1349]KGN70451.1 homoserine acetyltransferase [Porphyromonas sp. COT-108 OH1349]
MLKEIVIKDFRSEKGVEHSDITLSYELAGPSLGSAPIVVVNHALTGNSSVTGEKGWWNKLISDEGGIPLSHYTIISFNIPGNGYDGRESTDPESFSLKDIAALFIKGIESLGITEVYCIIGASMGGSLTWQMAHLRPQLAKKIFPIACDYRASDWLLTQTLIQKQILANSSDPLRDARIHAMSCYRTPQSLNVRFNSTQEEQEQLYDVERWLLYHGDTLKKRFKLSAYKVMTHLTYSIAVCKTALELAQIHSDIHMVSIDSDLLFTHDRAVDTYNELSDIKNNITLDTINSIHGHDAFLMEYEQLNRIVKPHFPTL